MEKLNISNLYEKKFLSPLDFHFACFIKELSGAEIPQLLLAAAFLSKHTSEGHVCLDLAPLANSPLMVNDEEIGVCPSLSQWLDILEQSPVVGHGSDYRPLILHKSRLYLERYWDYERKLIEFIRDRLIRKHDTINYERLKDGLTRLFPENIFHEVNWQKVAAFVSATRGFSVISGGPGTGKTTTVVKILALLREQVPEGEPLHFALSAPTGKAAARLKESINKVREQLNCPDAIKKHIPDDVSTIHRLLGIHADSSHGRYSSDNPLPFDVVVVDEASMVPLPLMSRLMQALRPDTRFILLGDRDQLASVEAGAVLGDICGNSKINNFSQELCQKIESTAGEKVKPSGSEQSNGIEDSIVQLQKSYRFSDDTGIGALSRCVKEGDYEKALNLIRKKKFSQITWTNLSSGEALLLTLKPYVINGFKEYLSSDDPFDALTRFDQFRILCAIRNSPYGVVYINSLVEKILKHQGLINPTRLWYRGRPVMITRNDYNLRLFNGDVGITLPDSETGGQLRVFFPGHEGSVRKFLPQMLTEYETVYTMTVHKSQGSEFDSILFIMPDRITPILTRELVYTALTRAKNNIIVMGTEKIFRYSVSQRIERASGLKEALWQ
jgi:exodeoxyribonuclease V alpha subunit